MAKPIVPSRSFLFIFSRGLRTESQKAAFSFCRQISTIRSPTACRSLQRLPLHGQSRGYKTVEEAKSRYRSGPFSWKAGALFFASAIGLWSYFSYEKARLERKRIAEATKGVGKPKVGGPFKLVDHNGKEFTSEDLKGKFSIVYFGFTHCPDICPEELDKLSSALDIVAASAPHNSVLPIFITCDPARDTPSVLKSYLAEFHPSIVGLTGKYEEIKDVCKKYRVYFSTPPDVKPGQDYLVDHSIYFYLMDPEGDFVEAIGRQMGPDKAASVILGHVKDWRGELDQRPIGDNRS